MTSILMEETVPCGNLPPWHEGHPRRVRGTKLRYPTERWLTPDPALSLTFPSGAVVDLRSRWLTSQNRFSMAQMTEWFGWRPEFVRAGSWRRDGPVNASVRARPDDFGYDSVIDWASGPVHTDPTFIRPTGFGGTPDACLLEERLRSAVYRGSPSATLFGTAGVHPVGEWDVVGFEASVFICPSTYLRVPPAESVVDIDGFVLPADPEYPAGADGTVYPFEFSGWADDARYGCALAMRAMSLYDVTSWTIGSGLHHS